MNSAVLGVNIAPRDAAPGAQAAGVALWAFIGVATSLFSLFIAAYVMRMEGSDWSPIAMPRQAWLSTALLLAGSGLLGLARRAARRGDDARAQRLLAAGGACALGFLASQLWAWAALQEARVALAGNPAASFFYLLTALHGLHVAGGLVAWALALHRPSAVRTRLLARYWHFLLAVWLVLFATLGWLTPEVVDFICGRATR
ncbi:MAG: cytochrome c oxidase subunit 3 [Pseudomonadota bacterium]